MVPPPLQILKILQMVLKNVTSFSLPITFIVFIYIYIFTHTSHKHIHPSPHTNTPHKPHPTQTITISQPRHTQTPKQTQCKISSDSTRTTSYTDNLVLGSSVEIGSRLRIPNHDSAKKLSLLQNAQRVSGEHAASDSMGTGISFPGA